MALAFDTQAQASFAATTSYTLAHTCTGTNLILMVGVWVNNDTDVLTGVTYGGVAMTRVDIQSLAGNGSTYLYQLVNPSTGANNIVASLSSSKSGCLQAASYTGAAQSGQMDSSAKGTAGPGASTQTFTTTTVANNCWTICVCRHDGTRQAAGAGTTYRGADIAFTLADSNAAITPAGSSSLIFNATNSSFAGVIASITPYTVPTFIPKIIIT